MKYSKGHMCIVQFVNSVLFLIWMVLKKAARNTDLHLSERVSHPLGLLMVIFCFHIFRIRH